MNLDQRLYIIQVIDGYKFAYKATENEGYRVVYLKLEKQLKMKIWNDTNIIKGAA